MNRNEIDSIAKEKAEKAESFFRSGYGCTQAVLLAFKEETGLDEKTLIKLGAPFGGGIGRMRQVCGAALGAFMLSGLLKSEGNRAEDYARVRDIAAKYTEENGSVVCAELLKGVKVTEGTAPEARDEGYYKRRPCPKLCASAAEIAAHVLLTSCQKSDELGEK